MYLTPLLGYDVVIQGKGNENRIASKLNNMTAYTAGALIQLHFFPQQNFKKDKKY